jgi:hypothetical protein
MRTFGASVNTPFSLLVNPEHSYTDPKYSNKRYVQNRMDAGTVKRTLLASSAWITWGFLYTAFTIGVNNDDGSGSQMGLVAAGFIFLIISLSVSFFVSLALIVKLKSKANTPPVIHTKETWLFLINYSFCFYCMYFVSSGRVTSELLAYFGLPVLLPQTILLLIFILRRKYLSAHA